MTLQQYIQAEKNEMALQAKATLLLAKLRMMQYEFFHSTEDLQEVVL
jgi:hypothetical protein